MLGDLPQWDLNDLYASINDSKLSSDKIEIEEHSHSAMAHAYEAGAAGLPCAIFRGYMGAELKKVNSNIKKIECPFTGEELTAVPSLKPDVAFIHAQKADKKGNVLIEGILGVQKEAVLASKKSLVTVEELSLIHI